MTNPIPNLDCMARNDLWEFGHKYQRKGSYARPGWRAECEALIGDRRRGYIGLAQSLGAYATNKAVAMDCRVRGDIQAAQIYETICDNIYDRLPSDLRW